MYMRGGALIQLIGMEVCAFVNVSNVMTRSNFGGCRPMLRGLASTKGHNQAFPIGS
jgi:hypothetical protein